MAWLLRWQVQFEGATGTVAFDSFGRRRNYRLDVLEHRLDNDMFKVNFDFILILINFDFMSCNSNFDFILYYNLLLCLKI